MGLAEEFKATAVELLDTFSVEVITIQKVSAQSYSTTTGVVGRTLATENVRAARVDIEFELVESYEVETFAFLIAGSEVVNAPIIGDTVKDANTVEYLIKRVITDQYNAVYKLLVIQQ